MTNIKPEQQIGIYRLPVCLSFIPGWDSLSEKPTDSEQKALSRETVISVDEKPKKPAEKHPESAPLFGAEHDPPLEDSEPLPWGEPMAAEQFAIAGEYIGLDGSRFHAKQHKPPRTRVVRWVVIRQQGTKAIPIPLAFALRWLRPATPTVYSTRPIDHSGDPLDL